jgi:hypothetical protein
MSLDLYPGMRGISIGALIYREKRRVSWDRRRDRSLNLMEEEGRRWPRRGLKEGLYRRIETTRNRKLLLA